MLDRYLVSKLNSRCICEFTNTRESILNRSRLHRSDRTKIGSGEKDTIEKHVTNAYLFSKLNIEWICSVLDPISSKCCSKHASVAFFVTFLGHFCRVFGFFIAPFLIALLSCFLSRFSSLFCCVFILVFCRHFDAFFLKLLDLGDAKLEKMSSV